MSKWCLIAGLVLACSFAAQAAGQTETPDNQQEPTQSGTVRVGFALQDQIHGEEAGMRLEVVPRLSYLLLTEFSYVSADRQYAANSAEEVAIYENLGLSFLYIEHEWMREQLQLPEGQGIFVATADGSGQGYAQGVRVGDLILEVNGQPVSTQYDVVNRLLAGGDSGQTIKLRRGSELLELPIRLSSTDAGDSEAERFVIGVHIESAGQVVLSQLGASGGVVVTEVVPGSAAERAGLQVNDVIVEAAGQPVSEPANLEAAVQGSGGQTIRVDFFRAGQRTYVELTPERGADVGQGGVDTESLAPAQMATLLFLNRNELIELQVPELTVEQRLERLEQQVNGIRELIENR